MNEQLSFAFDAAPASTSGLDLWREQHRIALESLAKRSGLPIGHQVRLWLASGILLEGRLLLVEDELFVDHPSRCANLRLQINRVDFQVAEVESCVRTD